MIKKQLEEKIDSLEYENLGLKYKAEKCEELETKINELNNKIGRLEGSYDLERTFYSHRIGELVLRNDILTMTPEEIETMVKVKDGFPEEREDNLSDFARRPRY